ncbi:MAG: tetratricopeptide repeat protein [Longimicrobiales bacterium]
MWYGTRDVARMVGLSESQVRAYVRAGLIEVERGPRNAYRFSFQDLVLLRAARGLIQARVPHLRVLRALRRLKAQLPPDRNLSELRILVDGDDVIVSDGAAAWNPASGQLHLDFQVAELSEEIAPLHASVRPAAPAVTADDWFERGVELELVSAEDAVTAYENALELNPRHADAHVNLGRLLHEARRLAQAELHYRAALAPGPHATAAYNLGIVLEDRQRQKEAVSAYLRALDADPHMADAHYNLSRLYEQLGDEASALRHLKSYRALTQGTGRA